MSATLQVTVTNIAATAIVVQSLCRNVTVFEDHGVNGFPSTDYYVMKPLASSPKMRIPSGEAYTFPTSSGLFVPGQVVGYIQTVAGSTTFDQDEDQT